jgi:hypothetical protein
MQLLRKQIRHGPKRPQLTPEEQADLARAAAALSTSLSPATPGEIAEMIDRLAWHYPRTARPAAARRSIAEDWIADLAHLPADIIDAACAAWRRAPNDYAPTPGTSLRSRRRSSRRAASGPGWRRSSPPRPGAARPPSPPRNDTPERDRA